MRVYVDGGHGAKGNSGNSGVRCVDEQDHTASAGVDLAAALTAAPGFDAKLSRKGTARPSYSRRLEDARKWRADVMIGLHTDARGEARWWEPEPGVTCLRNDDDPGFAVLWSDDGDDAMTKEEKIRLGRMIKSLVDQGRLEYLRSRGMEGRVVGYVEPTTAPENRLLGARAAQGPRSAGICPCVPARLRACPPCGWVAKVGCAGPQCRWPDEASCPAAGLPGGRPPGPRNFGDYPSRTLTRTHRRACSHATGGWHQGRSWRSLSHNACVVEGRLCCATVRGDRASTGRVGDRSARHVAWFHRMGRPGVHR